MKKFDFIKAIPVWENGKDKEKNYNLAFRSVVNKADNAIASISAANTYQLFVNGEMVSHGPARAGHGNFRVDKIDISDYLTNDKNAVVIYAISYCIMSFYMPKHAGFLCAEVVADGEVVNPDTGDSVTASAAIISLLAVSGAAIVALRKKED